MWCGKAAAAAKKMPKKAVRSLLLPWLLLPHAVERES